MGIFTLLENLNELIENSSKVPFSTKVMVEKEELTEIIEQIRLKLPDEIKQAKRVKDERVNILNEAKDEANKILKEAEIKIVQMVDEHVITKQAIMQKEEIIENASRISKEISNGTRDYADAILEKVQDVLKETMDIVTNNRNELK